MKAKNIGLLATLAMVVTVGGVYATWNYATSSPAEVDLNTGITINDATVDGSKGTLKAVLSDDASVHVKNAGEYQAALEVTGKLTVTFTAAEYAEPDTKDGLEIAITYGISGDEFEVDDEEQQHLFTLYAETDGDAVKYYDNVTSLEIPLSEIFGLNSNYDTVLETYVQYQAFATLVNAAEITINVADRG